MSRRARLELGSSAGDALAQALKDIAEQQIPQHERVEAFLGGVPRAGQSDIVEAQFELVPTAEPEFTEADWREMTQEAGEETASGRAGTPGSAESSSDGG